jgi:hypothetical protein
MASERSLRLRGMAGVTGLLVACGLTAWTAVSAAPKDGDVSPAVVKARQNAELMHHMYAATLEVMHRRYFRNDRAAVPARALEDVFAEMEANTKVKANWISVNTAAMSINHEPKSEFERRAAAAIAAGKREFELVENGHYRRATPIPLGAGCVTCHVGLAVNASKTPRFAGLVISVPLNNE